jgi:hypothetical protein
MVVRMVGMCGGMHLQMDVLIVVGKIEHSLTHQAQMNV